MKRLILLSAAALALTACGSSAPTPTPSGSSVTGYWDMAFTGNGKTLAANASLSQTDSPATGDFKGTFTAPGIAGSAPVTGNRNTGKISAIDEVNSTMACTGTFSGNTYKGTCKLKIYDGSGGTLDLNMAKR